MEYKEFYIPKKSGTYAETLEAYGVANLVEQVLEKSQVRFKKVEIENTETHYIVRPSSPITEQMLECGFFQIIKFIKGKPEKDKNDSNKFIEVEVPKIANNSYFDYPKQQAERKAYSDRRKAIDADTSLTKEEKAKRKKSIDDEKKSEFGKRLDSEYDVYKMMVGNPYPAFKSLYTNIIENQHYFSKILEYIFDFYKNEEQHKTKPSKNDTLKIPNLKVTAQQLFAPSQGKGLNRAKADGPKSENIKNAFWISETMKISGALSQMFCQGVKVGDRYDQKIYVCDFKKIEWKSASEVSKSFKKNLRQTSPIKLDILNQMKFVQEFLIKTPLYRGRVKNCINGFHSVYQKALSKHTTTVVNINFFSVPYFINIESEADIILWAGEESILESQIKIINGIEEFGESIQALQSYRDFWTTGNVERFFDFSQWYASFLTRKLSEEKWWIKPFSIETLNLFFKSMENIMINEIIENDGFKEVAYAIRKSTVSVQYTPKEARQFEIRYGLAQELQNKSKSQQDFIVFIGEFIGTYNAETARKAEKAFEKKESIRLRRNVREDKLSEFYSLLDKYPSRLVGALLVSYGFALAKKTAAIVIPAGGDNNVNIEEETEDENED